LGLISTSGIGSNFDGSNGGIPDGQMFHADGEDAFAQTGFDDLFTVFWQIQRSAADHCRLLAGAGKSWHKKISRNEKMRIQNCGSAARCAERLCLSGK
jgi:hypothetical protein